MEKDIDVRDPRGKRIRCSVWQWEHHVLIYHPDLAGQEALVEKALCAPSGGYIFTSHHKDGRCVYYTPFRNRLEIKVVVGFDQAGIEGDVVSVSIVSRRASGEIMIWPTKN
jgi:hypothetical protein